MTKAEIMAMLDELGVAYSKRDTKQSLQLLLDAALAEMEPAPFKGRTVRRLRVRQEPSTDAKELRVLAANAPVSGLLVGEWIELTNKRGYVMAQFVEPLNM